MQCPNCGQVMNVRNVDNEIVLHCATCGSSFFDKKGIDKITPSSARMLAEESQGQYVLGNQKVCPKDKSVLLEKIDPALPKNTVLLECPSCEGIFAYPDDLLKYKGIKDPKPLASGAFNLLPAPRSLFMLASFAVLSLAVLLNAPRLARFTSTNTRASTMKVSNVHFSKVGPQYFILFSTNEKTTANVIFYDSQKKQTFESVSISTEPKTVHQAVLPAAFDPTTDVYYSVVFPPNATGTELQKITVE